MGIKIGNIDASYFKVGSDDCSIYLGDTLLYSGGTPTPSLPKWIATYTSGTTSSAECDSTSAITNGEIRKANLVSVDIGDCVTSIGDSTFENCNTMTSCTIGSSVTSIGTYVFYRCSGLTSIDIPDSVTSIGMHTFEGCSGLTSVIIGSGVTSIGSGVFYYTNGTFTLTLYATTPPTLSGHIFDEPNGGIFVPAESVDAYKNAPVWSVYAEGIMPIPTPTAIKFQATYSDSSSYSELCDSSTELTTATTKPNGYVYSAMTNAVIGDCITSLGTDAFRDCSGLTSISLPSVLTTIGENGIRSCTSLSSVTIPNTVTSIGTAAFRYCINLTSVTIPSGVTSISNSTFNSCRKLSSITIPDSVTSIGSSGFCNCSAATSINIGSSVTSIGNFAFGRITGVTSVNIPNNVTSINDTAFRYCNKLTTVTIGSGITSIGSYAFSNCTSLSSLTITAISPPTLGNTPFSSTSSSLIIYVPSGSVNTYKSASGWSNYSSRIQAIPNS